MGKILLEGMEFYAYHGHLKEERVIGTMFVVDLEIEFESGNAEISDHLHDTVNYMDIYRCVKGVMDVKSHLLENVARRILDAVKSTFPIIRSLTVKISKINPPMGGKVKQVSCILSG